MKPQPCDELSFPKSLAQSKTSNFIIFVIALIFILTIIPLRFFPDYPSNFLLKSLNNSPAAGAGEEAECDLFIGEWVPNPDAPYYTNDTCDAIQEHQNCLKYGRPDSEFLKWRWKPDACDLPIFDPHQFLQLVEGKSMAFVGDSVARNHMQSLICLLSPAARPSDVPHRSAGETSYRYAGYNFTVSIFFSPFLVRSERTDPADIRRPFNLFLDESDDLWASKIGSFDYLIISAGQWFFHPSYFYLNRTLVGCHFCREPDVAPLTLKFSYQQAFRSAFQTMTGAAAGFKGVAFLRTFSPSHFEGGGWNSGGDCARTRPVKRGEIGLQFYDLEMYRIQLEEMRVARSGGELRLLDATGLLLARPDGHPRNYGRWPVANQTFPTDCVHWCLPGPIDALNDLLLELMKRENKTRRSTRE